MKKNKNRIYEILPIIVFTISMFVLLVFLIACEFLENDKREQAEKQKEYIQELEEKVESYEKELTDITLNEGLLDDIKLEIQIKQNELDEIETKIEDKKQELEEMK